eukprot:TRINITY_DN2995_c0_g1_i1.p1 TRINITY_DN2995_c0_g1~~TRINITY_DN2995_c0_g1_i1.p1  ORF type:complete len:689 (-),score=178.55 TRINITY_DN2995_c0_g1_i1:12-2078(-)
MSRHRGIRGAFDEYYDQDDDDYDGGFTGSPSSASPGVAKYLANKQQFQLNLGNFLNKGQPTVDEDEEEDFNSDLGLIESKLPAVVEALGDACSEEEMIEALRINNYDPEAATVWLLDRPSSKSPVVPHSQFDMEIDNDDEFEERRKQAFTQKKADSAVPRSVHFEGDVIAVQRELQQATLGLGPRAASIEIASPSPVRMPARDPSKERVSSPAPDFGGFALAPERLEERLQSASPKIERQMSMTRRKEVEALQAQEAAREKPHISLVVIGHVDAGKSTIMGHLLYLLGNVQQRTMHRFEKESKNLGKASFAFAFVLDEHAEERARGVTIDVAVTNFETDHRRVTLLDAPGHRDFVPNMISGASQADVAILIVDATTGAFENGFDSDGQTKEHALLARSLGVTQLGVVINKLDTVDWSQQRFDEISAKLGAFLKQSGFLPKNIWYVPCSGLTGENVIERNEAKLMAWYDGPTLIQRIDEFPPATREVNKAFRLCISDVYKATNFGSALGGKIEGGLVSVGDRLLVQPLNELCTVKGIRVHGNVVEFASAGENVDLSVADLGLPITSIAIGDVLCDPERPMRIAKRFVGQIITFTLKRPIVSGHQVELLYHGLNEPASITSLISILDKATGEVRKKKPRALSEGITAQVEISVQRAIPVELYSEYKPLGRFTLREGGRTVAAGIISELRL